MSIEQRDLVEAQDKSKTILDESYGQMLEHKWGPMVQHVRKSKDRVRLGAMLFENEAQHLESLLHKPGPMMEDTTTANIAYYTRFIFPILRKLLPNLIAPDLVSMQPMTAPFGAIFYWDMKYGKTKGMVSAGGSAYDQFDRFYASEFIDREFLATGDGVNYGGAGVAWAGGVSWKPVRPLDTTVPYQCKIEEYNPITGALIQSVVDNGAGGFTGALSGVINYATGAITNFKFAVAPALNNTILASYWYDSENNPLVGDMYLDLQLEPIKAISRKLKFRMSSEAQDDLRSVHGIDGDTEITDAEAQHMALEIDREIIMDLYAGASSPGDSFDFATPAGEVDVQHKRSLLTKLSKVSAGIHMATMRGPANFIVLGPMAAAHICQLETHGDYNPIFANDYYGTFDGTVVPESLGVTTTQFGVTKIGTLARKWVIYQDPYFPADKALLGYKGPSILHAGYVYAPYIPMQVSNAFLNPEDWSIVKGMRTRYAKKLLHAGKFYGVMTFTNV